MVTSRWKLVTAIFLVLSSVGIFVGGTLKALSAHRATFRAADSRMADLKLAQEVKSNVRQMVRAQQKSESERSDLLQHAEAIRCALNEYKVHVADTAAHKRAPDNGFEKYAEIEAVEKAIEEFENAAGDNTQRPLAEFTSAVDERLEQAFGIDCPELNWSIKCDWRSQCMVLAAENFKITEEGRASFTPLHAAIFSKSASAEDFPEISTIEADEAVLCFDQPVTNILDISHRKLVEAELVHNVRFRNNRGNRQPNDDGWLKVPTGIVHYQAEPNGRPRIWTEAKVYMMREPTVVTAQGMVINLANETKISQSSFPSSIERVIFHHSVRMTFSMESDGTGGFFGSGRFAPQTGYGAFIAEPNGSAQEPKAPETSRICIETDGPLVYDVSQDKGHFERAKPQSKDMPGLDRVKVIRSNGDSASGKYDQIYCDELELSFRSGTTDAKPKDAQAEQSFVRRLESVTASGNVEIISDSQMLNAVCASLHWDVHTRKTTLKNVQALKDGNELLAQELQITSDTAGTHITASGQVADMTHPHSNERMQAALAMLEREADDLFDVMCSDLDKQMVAARPRYRASVGIVLVTTILGSLLLAGAAVFFFKTHRPPQGVES